MKYLRLDLKVCEGCGALWLRGGRRGRHLLSASCAARLAEFPAPRGKHAGGRKRTSGHAVRRCNRRLSKHLGRCAMSAAVVVLPAVWAVAAPETSAPEAKKAEARGRARSGVLPEVHRRPAAALREALHGGGTRSLLFWDARCFEEKSRTIACGASMTSSSSFTTSAAA